MFLHEGHAIMLLDALREVTGETHIRHDLKPVLLEELERVRKLVEAYAPPAAEFLKMALFEKLKQLNRRFAVTESDNEILVDESVVFSFQPRKVVWFSHTRNRMTGRIHRTTNKREVEYSHPRFEEQISELIQHCGMTLPKKWIE